MSDRQSDLQEAIRRIIVGTASKEDVATLLRALATGQVALATGARAVAVGGDAQGAVIVTGDNNQVLVALSASEWVQLEQALPPLASVPDLPEHYIRREEALDRVQDMLLRGQGAAVGIVGVRGMGGIGKSVLAAALARDPQMRAAFPDGVAWLSLGREPNLPARQEDLALLLTRQRERFEDAIQGRLVLQALLADKTALVILDDVWDVRHAEAFLGLGDGIRLLITTRDQRVLDALEAPTHAVDVLLETQALELLADWAGQRVADLPDEAREVARECGYLPLALAMVGAFVRKNPESWARALRRLQKADLAHLERLFPGYPYPNLLAALEVSVEALPEEDRARYLNLAVFPEEEAIPLDALAVFWAPLGWDRDDVQTLAEALVDRSLARWADETHTALTLHDLQRDYLRRARQEDLPALHRRLLQALAVHLGVVDYPEQPIPWAEIPPDALEALPTYFWDHLIAHHLAAGWRPALYHLLTDFAYLEVRCRATSPYDLKADYRRALAAWPEAGEEKQVLAALEEGVRLQAPHIAQAPEWLFPALYHALAWQDAPDGPLHRLAEAWAVGRRNWLRSRLDPRPEPPPWLRSLEGHTGWVRAVAVSPDGRFIVSGSEDRTVKVWEAESGRPLRALKGHTDGVNAVAVSPDGRFIVSGSWDDTVKVWEAESGRLLRSLEGHTFWVNAVAVSPDGRFIVSGSDDRTVKVWEAESGRPLRALEGHTGAVRAVAVSPGGRFIVSGSDDRTVKVWETQSGRPLRALEGHTWLVNAVAVSPGGRFIVSGSWDDTVKVWEAESGRPLRALEGHTGVVNAVAVSPGGRFIVSGSSDRTLRLWEAAAGAGRVLFWNDAPILSLALSPEGRTVACGDGAGRVWIFDWVR